MHRQQPGLLLRRAGLLRERLARARRDGEQQPVVSSPSHARITTVARAVGVEIETPPGDARPQGAMLMRDFLRASLYDPDRGYFSRPVPPVGRLPEPIEFSKLVGQAEYRAVLARAHSAKAAAAGDGDGKQSDGGGDSGASAAAGPADAGRLLGGGDWLTPAEIFRPWYGAAVAHYVLEAHALEERERGRRRRRQLERRAQAGAAAAAGISSSSGRRVGQQQPPPVVVNKKLTPMVHHDRAPLTATAAAAAGADPAAAEAATQDGAAAPPPPAAPNNNNSNQQQPSSSLEETPLYIVEIGGGTGALALSVLDHIRDAGPPGVYARTTYACVEVSAPLGARQRNAVGVEGGHGAAFVSVLGDATERLTWDAVGRAVPGMPIVLSAGARAGEGGEEAGRRAGGGGGGGGGNGSGLPSSSSLGDDAARDPPPRVFVLAMEVLDNLPHDRIERAAPGQPWLQTAVAPKPPRAAVRLPSSSSRGGWAGGGAGGGGNSDGGEREQQWRQVLQPVTDPLVADCARVVLPLLASAAGGDAAAPAVLAGIGGDEEDEGQGGGDDRRAATSEPSVPPAAAAAPPGPSAPWGWDPATWLRRLLAAATGEQLDPVAAWLPTASLALLRCVHGALPGRNTLVASDFDALPGVQVEGHGAPIVSGRTVEGEGEESEGEEEGGGGEGEGGEEGGGMGKRRRAPSRRRLVARDHAGVLVPWGTADIFFPTDFDALRALYVSAATGEANEAPGGGGGSGGARLAPAPVRPRAPSSSSPSPPSSPPLAAVRAACQHMPTADFMAAFAESKRTRTLSGYNPLLQDFKNTRLFIGEARRKGSGDV